MTMLLYLSDVDGGAPRGVPVLVQDGVELVEPRLLPPRRHAVEVVLEVEAGEHVVLGPVHLRLPTDPI